MFFAKKKSVCVGNIYCMFRLEKKFWANLCVRLTVLCIHLQGCINDKGKIDIPLIYFYILTKQISLLHYFKNRINTDARTKVSVLTLKISLEVIESM